jgi:hypothetical protein
MTLAFRHIVRSGALDAHARELGSRLEKLGERVTQCHMTLEGLLAADSGGFYFVKIELAVPGAQIYAESLQVDCSTGGNIHLAMRDAFDNAQRQLQELHSSRESAANPALDKQRPFTGWLSSARQKSSNGALLRVHLPQ